MLIQFTLLMLSCKTVEPFRKIFDILEVTPENPTDTVIFFHGHGDTGPGLKQWLDILMGTTELFKGMRVIFPTGPLIDPHIKDEIKLGSTGGKLTSSGMRIRDCQDWKPERAEYTSKQMKMPFFEPFRESDFPEAVWDPARQLEVSTSAQVQQELCSVKQTNKPKAQEFHGWFDDRFYVFKGKEDMAAIHRVALDIIEVMKNETKHGVDVKRIFLGGFGMGGNMAMHIAYRYKPEVAGVFALSTFLKRYSAVYRSVRLMKKDKSKPFKPPPLFLCMAEQDLETAPVYTLKTFRRMRRLGVNVKLFTMLNSYHELKKQELLQVEKWIKSMAGRSDLLIGDELDIVQNIPPISYGEFLKYNYTSEEDFLNSNSSISFDL